MQPSANGPNPRDAETFLAGPQASGVGSSRAAGSREDDGAAMFGPQGDVGTGPMQVPPTGNETGAETPGEEPREGMERRQAADGRQYTMQEFQDHYGATWEWRWQRAHRASGDPSGLPPSPLHRR